MLNFGLSDGRRLPRGHGIDTSLYFLELFFEIDLLLPDLPDFIFNNDLILPLNIYLLVVLKESCLVLGLKVRELIIDLL